MLPPATRRPCAKCSYDLQSLRGRTHCPSCGEILPPDLRDPDPPQDSRAESDWFGAVFEWSGPILILAALTALIIVFSMLRHYARIVNL